MKNLKQNPFFYLSLVLGFAVVFEVAGIVNAAWTAPTLNPPNGNPAQPLDTSALRQTKLGSLTILGSSQSVSPYGVQIDPSGHVLFGPTNGGGNITPNAAISYDGTNLVYTNVWPASQSDWHAIGSGGIGTWPISIPTTGPQGLNGFFGFQLANTGWTGFDLASSTTNRLVLGVSQAQVNNAKDIFDVEISRSLTGGDGSGSWQHMMEIRADGTIQATGYYDSNNNPVPAIGTWCGIDAGSLVINCGGQDPKVSCPAGYSKNNINFGTVKGDATIPFATCIFTGYPKSGNGGSGSGSGSGITGTQPLYMNVHTAQDCTNIGGTPYLDTVSTSNPSENNWVCQLINYQTTSQTGCPSGGWQPYVRPGQSLEITATRRQSYSTPSAICANNNFCSTGSHTFSLSPIESCTYEAAPNCYNNTGYATITQIACY